MKERVEVGHCQLEVACGDITQERVDCIVNAANSSLMGGGGVDGAIHRAAGPKLLEACKEVRDRQGPCPTGQAVMTEAGELPAKWVIHAVGPRWHGGSKGEQELLASAYQSCLQLAAGRGAESIAFPAISTGAYGYPIEDAAELLLPLLFKELPSYPSLKLVRLVLYSKEDYSLYCTLLERYC